MAPCIQPAGCLGKACRHFHAEEIVCFILRDAVEFFSLARIQIREFHRQNVCLIGDQLSGRIIREFSGLNVIVRHKLTVRSGRTGAVSDRTKLIINGKCAVFIQVREIGSTVVFKVSALVINTLQEQMIDVCHTGKQLGQRIFMSCFFGGRRIAFFIQISRKQTRVIVIWMGAEECMLYGITVNRKRIIEIDHFHRNTVLTAVNGFYLCQMILCLIRFLRIYNGKVEILCLGQRTGYNMSLLRL